MKNAPDQTTIEGALDKRDFNPEYPAHGTQPARLLSALLQGRRINPLAAWKGLGIYRLSDTVYQLRGMGWPVVTDRLDVANRFNEPCRVAQYRLPADAIEATGERGRGFAEREMQSIQRRAA